MSNPKEKIGRGLDAIEREKSDAQFNLKNLSGAPASVSDLNSLAQQATAKRDRLRQLSSGILSAVEKHRKKKTAEFSELGRERTDSGSTIDTLGDNRRRMMLEREVSRYRRDALKVSADERATLLSELREFTQKISAVKDSWSDPVGVLMRSTRGDQKRATYVANLAAAGPVELEMALRDSVLTGDKALAAAAMSRLDSMPKESRKLVRFSKRDIAESLVIEEWRAANQWIAVSELAFAEAALADDEAEGKKVSSHRKIGLGARKTDLAKLLGTTVESLNANPDDPASTVRKTETLEQALDEKFPGVPGSGQSLNFIGG